MGVLHTFDMCLTWFHTLVPRAQVPDTGVRGKVTILMHGQARDPFLGGCKPSVVTLSFGVTVV